MLVASSGSWGIDVGIGSIVSVAVGMDGCVAEGWGVVGGVGDDVWLGCKVEVAAGRVAVGGIMVGVNVGLGVAVLGVIGPALSLAGAFSTRMIGVPPMAQMRLGSLQVAAGSVI